MADTSEKSGKRTAFTLVELLIVIAIIAVLISILVPALGRAREFGRVTKCLANQRTLVQGVHGFAADHQGYGQLLAAGYGDFAWLRYLPKWYVYEAWPSSLAEFGVPAGRIVASPWPVAYGPYIGAPGLKSEDFFVSWKQFLERPRSILNKTKVGVLRCPSDRLLAGEVRQPNNSVGALSYSINGDIFDLDLGWPQVWRDGGLNGTNLEGRLDRVVRPFEVLLFVDGQQTDSDHTSRMLASGHGPSLSSIDPDAHHVVKLPAARHSRDGGVVASYVDGHAQYLKPVQWLELGGTRYPIRHSPDPRITPYEPGADPSPAGDGGPRSRR